MLFDESRRKIPETPLGFLRMSLFAPRIKYSRRQLKKAIEVCRQSTFAKISQASPRSIAWGLKALVDERRREREFFRTKEGRRYPVDCSVRGEVKKRRVAKTHSRMSRQPVAAAL